MNLFLKIAFIYLLFSMNSYAITKTSQLKYNLPRLTMEEVEKEDGVIEWWYFDVEDKKNNTHIVFKLARRDDFINKKSPSIEVQITSDILEKEYNKNYIFKSFDWKEVRNKSYQYEISFGQNRKNLIRFYTEKKGDKKVLEQNIIKVDLYINFKDLSAVFSFTPKSLGFTPAKDFCYFKEIGKPKNKSCVHFAAPVMNVSGNLKIEDQRIEIINAVGYHDHPWSTVSFLETHKLWHWGRALSKELSIVYARVIPNEKFNGHLNFLYILDNKDWNISMPLKDPMILNNDQYTFKSGNIFNESKYGLSFPHELFISFFDSNSGNERYLYEINVNFNQLLLDEFIYNRSLMNFSFFYRNSRRELTGWTEYVDTRTWIPVEVISFFSRLKAFWNGSIENRMNFYMVE